MPRPIHPHTFSCPACRWQLTVIPASDCLMKGFDCYNRCPQCLHTELNKQPASWMAIIAARLANTLPRPLF